MDDKSIVDLYWQRSDKAIEETAAKYGAYCRTIAYNILSNAEDCEECVNDTYMSAWNSMPDKRPDRLSPFLAKITRNHALHLIEKQQRQKRGGGEAELALEELAECIPAKQSVEAQIEAKELVIAVNYFLSLLPADERKVFFSRYFFMASIDEISEKFRFSRSKTLSMLHRTRIKLRKFLFQEELC